MSTLEKPLVYLILGASGSGRREVLADLLDGGLDPADRRVVLLSAEETANEQDARLGRVARWKWEADGISLEDGAMDEADYVFFVTDGRRNPVDQIEASKLWLNLIGGELGRIICVVNCQLAEAHPELIAWYEACIHFADVVLLAKREGVSNKWLSDFQNRFKDQFFPCIFEFVKQGRVKNPPLILDPLPLRVSHLFDEPDWVIIDEKGERDAEDDDEEEPQDAEEEIEIVQKEDPYLERRAGGRRVKEIVEISKYLAS